MHSFDLALAAGLGQRVVALERSAAEPTVSASSLAQCITAAVGLGVRVLCLEKATADAALSRDTLAQGISAGAKLQTRMEVRMLAVEERATLDGEEVVERGGKPAPEAMAGLQVRMPAAEEAGPADATGVHRWGDLR